MKQLFHLGESAASTADLLLLRLGSHHAVFAYTSAAADRVEELGYFSTEEWNSSELAALAEKIGRPARKMHIALDHPVAFIAPATVSASVMGSLYSFGDDIILQEEVPGWQNRNIFAIPQLLQQWVNDKFPDAGCRHQLTLLMKNLPGIGEEGAIFVDLREKDLQLLCARNGQLLFSGNFEYSTPHDVLFYLLKCCHQFGLDQEKLSLRLSGLIDKDSALYNELYQYFIDISFRNPSWQQPPSDLPPHFFTSLNDLALCVS